MTHTIRWPTDRITKSIMESLQKELDDEGVGEDREIYLTRYALKDFLCFHDGVSPTVCGFNVKYDGA